MKLDQVASRSFAPGSRRFIASKVLADSIIFGPLHIAAFFTAITLGEGGTLKDAQKKIQADFIPTFCAEAGLWPVIQAFNFWKVQLNFQLLVVNSFTILDATFISWVQHQREGWFQELLSSKTKQNKPN